MARAEVRANHRQHILLSLRPNRTDVLRTGVKLIYLPPYSPDLNPIKGFFAKLEAFIRRNSQSYKRNPDRGINTFLE
jgi:transposase